MVQQDREGAILQLLRGDRLVAALPGRLAAISNVCCRRAAGGYRRRHHRRRCCCCRCCRHRVVWSVMPSRRRSSALHWSKTAVGPRCTASRGGAPRLPLTGLFVSVLPDLFGSLPLCHVDGSARAIDLPGVENSTTEWVIGIHLGKIRLPSDGVVVVVVAASTSGRG